MDEAEQTTRAWARDVLPWVLLVTVALVLRLVDLGDRAFHHDESQIAYFSWSTITDKHTYEYLPLLHGPWTYYATALSYALGGVGDMTARLPAALAGTAMVGLPFLLREQLGRVAAFTAAAGLAVGPVYLYYSRFAREDIHIALLTLAMIVVAARMLDAPRRWHPIALLALLAASFTVKESTLIFGFVVATYLAALLVAVRVRSGRVPWVVAAARAPGWRWWLVGVVAFAVVFAALFSSFGSHWGGVWDGLYEGPSYWLGQHDIGRGGDRWFLYLLLLVAYEPLALGLGLLGAAVVVAAWLRPAAVIPGWTGVVSPRVRSLCGYLVWAFVVSLAVYSWAGERFAWLVMHPLLPLLLLAGIGVQVLWASRRRGIARAGLALCVAGLAATVYADVRVNALAPESARELLVTTQTGPQVPAAVRAIRALDARLLRTEDRHATIAVDPGAGASFPWAWYLRDLPAGYAAPASPNADVLILTEPERTRLLPQLGGYRALPPGRLDLRVGWARDYDQASLRALWRWYRHRDPWNPLSPLPEWVYLRRTG